MDVPWACSAAYSYVLHLEPASRAWEYLRRNPRYVSDWGRYRRTHSPNVTARWGLSALVDPRLDAREATPIWIICASPPLSLVRDDMTSPEERSTLAQQFSLWRLPGRKSLFAGAAGLRLIVRMRSEQVQVRLGGHLSDGDRFACQIPVDRDDGATWSALASFRALMPVSGSGRECSGERPSRADLFHVRALQVLDGLAAGATQRELAVALFGNTAVARGWQPDGALRAQTRYLIRRARALMAGEYRSLIAACPSAVRPGGRAGHGSRSASHEV